MADGLNGGTEGLELRESRRRPFKNPRDDHSSVQASCCRAEAEPIRFSLARLWWSLPQGGLLVIAEQLKDNEGRGGVKPGTAVPPGGHVCTLHHGTVGAFCTRAWKEAP